MTDTFALVCECILWQTYTYIRLPPSAAILICLFLKFRNLEVLNIYQSRSISLCQVKIITRMKLYKVFVFSHFTLEECMEQQKAMWILVELLFQQENVCSILLQMVGSTAFATGICHDNSIENTNVMYAKMFFCFLFLVCVLNRENVFEFSFLVIIIFVGYPSVCLINFCLFWFLFFVNYVLLSQHQDIHVITHHLQ